jgi:hypothetical protein
LVGTVVSAAEKGAEERDESDPPETAPGFAWAQAPIGVPAIDPDRTGSHTHTAREILNAGVFR